MTRLPTITEALGRSNDTVRRSNDLDRVVVEALAHETQGATQTGELRSLIKTLHL